MDFLLTDFNDADAYFAGDGAKEWADIDVILRGAPLFMQSSDQQGMVGRPIFDPKATNAFLHLEAARRGWHTVPVPEGLRPFGVDWDAGKGSTLAEWQFSNYPFLWNNVIRSEAIYNGQVLLPGLDRTRALIIVTKSGLFPASNSTLYYEQGAAQLLAVTAYNTFSIPIRLVGLTLSREAQSVEVVWSEYGNPRYDRSPIQQIRRILNVRWQSRARKYDTPNAYFEL